MEKYIVIQSKIKNQTRWEGKGWTSENPAKLYMNFESAATALESYWFHEGVCDNRRIEFIILSEEDKNILLSQNKIQY